MRLSYDVKTYADPGECCNTLILNLHNSSYHTQSYPIIVNYIVWRNYGHERVGRFVTCQSSVKNPSIPLAGTRTSRHSKAELKNGVQSRRKLAIGETLSNANCLPFHCGHIPKIKREGEITEGGKFLSRNEP